MIRFLEALRFEWKKNELQVLFAAMADAGPCDVAQWSVRSGVPRNHVATALRGLEQAGAVKIEPRVPDGLCVFVTRPEFWRVREMVSRPEWLDSYGSPAQLRLGLVTEAPGLAQALGDAGGVAGGALDGFRNPEGLPESGEASGIRNAVPFNVQRSTPLKNSLEAFNVERSTGASEIRNGWMEPESEAEALAACALLLGGAAEMKNWGGRWRNRWRANPGGLRKVLNMVREDQANGRAPNKGSNWGRYASDLWDRFVEVKA